MSTPSALFRLDTDLFAGAIGLTSARLADGAGDVLAGLTLGAPVGVVGWCALPARAACSLW
jgi:hypothetical protein